ncbi:MAG: C40 family peptidase [Zoogloeaceae bacterium]|nr:C40 family peptidase [Zoogloeaceae bacterium]
MTFSSSALAETNADAQPDEKKSFIERYSNAAHDVILKGLEFIGIRYRMGGTSPDAGLDCSSYVQLVYREAADLVLPRTAREQAGMGKAVGKAEPLKPGDLVFFNTMRRAFSHVGIYLGDNYFLHAPSVGGAVRVESMQNSYWVQRYNGARRLIDASADTSTDTKPD